MRGQEVVGGREEGEEGRKAKAVERKERERVW